jgi:hypothetical protein
MNMQATKNMNALQPCIASCWECRHTCQVTLFQHCLEQGGAHTAAAHVKLMVDCMEICQTAADFMVRDSALHTMICAACAATCEACAASCAAIDDKIMQHCAEVCLRCAKICREMGRLRQAA